MAPFRYNHDEIIAYAPEGRSEEAKRFMTTASMFLRAYGLMKERMFIDHLAENKNLCLIVSPKSIGKLNPNSKNYYEYIESIAGGENFLNIESFDYNSGYIHKCPKQTTDLYFREELDDPSTLDFIDKFNDRLDIDIMAIFGGNIHQCLLGLEKSLRFCERPAYMLQDVSIGGIFPKIANLSPVMCEILNELIPFMEDLSFLKQASGKPLKEKLQIFESAEFMDQITEMKYEGSQSHKRITYSKYFIN